MSSDDPFANNDNDKTVLRPMPGGRRPDRAGADQPPSPPRETYSPGPVTQDLPVDRPPPVRSREVNDLPAIGQLINSGINPLVTSAGSLLVLGAQLRSTLTQDRVDALKERIVGQLRQFEDRAYAQGIDRDTVLTARYLLCTYLDGAVMSTPWGSESGWTNQSLLSVFHNETWGGEKFFLILEQHQQMPSQSIDLLELIFICLALGFQGKYALSTGSMEQLTAIQDSLYRLISSQRGEFERDLSPHWEGVRDRRNALTRYVPMWVIGAVLGVLLLVIYSGFRFTVGQSNASIYDDLDRIIQQQAIDGPQ